MPAGTPLSPGMQANFKGFTFVNESSIDHHVKIEPSEEDMEDDTLLAEDSWHRGHRLTNSTDQRMSGAHKVSEGTDSGIFNVDENF
ncbi:Serine/threonine-protein kinase [Penicillium malachiteum]|uniref:Serine/threonine-protein kinase n=1 Tax=Penicillium malachiteum TaxID=1324776 RepID=UPI002547AC02|nr:Serine/threonine-protein kinase [Penicillium malachiteum]KAJ5736865.1 Serine/threonine-protein kinase [Penicillium malachiteum]